MSDWTGKNSKDWKDGRTVRKNKHVQPHAGETTDPEISRILSLMGLLYDPTRAEGDVPTSLDKTKLNHLIRGVQDTLGYDSAIDRGNWLKLDNYQGSTMAPVDISGRSAIYWMDDMMAKEGRVVYLWGETGTGKSATGGSLIESYLQEYPNAQILSNVRGYSHPDENIDENIHEVFSWGKFKEIVEEDPNNFSADARPKIFLFDEASSSAYGGGKDGYDTREKLGWLIYYARKFRIAIIVAGHDAKSVHPVIREHAICINKPDKDDPSRATVYNSIDTQGRGEGQITDFTGLPMTNFDYNQYDAMPWSWDEEAEEVDGTEVEQLSEEDVRLKAKEDLFREMNDNDVSIRDIVEQTGVPRSTVGDMIKRSRERQDALAEVSD